jgi:hypothetical protein
MTAWQRVWSMRPHTVAARRWKRFVRRAHHKRNRRAPACDVLRHLDERKLG